MTTTDEERLYSPLYESETLIEERTTNIYEVSRRRYRILVIALSLSCLINIFYVTSAWSVVIKDQIVDQIPNLYSPAGLVVQPALRKFSPAFGLPPAEAIYIQPPSTEVDLAWKDLYDTSLAITRAEAELLPNKTIALSSGADTPFLTGLNVFHDLHCLDSIRKTLWVGKLDLQGDKDSSAFASSHQHHEQTSQTAKVDLSVLKAYRAEMHDISHIMHCVNSLRESIMCHSDITPLSWQFVQEVQDVRVFSDVVHQCRDFDAIRQWAHERVYTGTLDQSDWVNGQPEEVGGCARNEGDCGWK